MLGRAMNAPLNLPEEVILLTLDDETGRPLAVPAQAVHLALAGAAVMELALAGRLDSDLDRLFVTSPVPLGDPLLDAVLARIGAAQGARDSRWWMGQLAADGVRMRRALLERLLGRGVLRRPRARRLWPIPARRYHKADGAVAGAMRARLRAVLLEGGIPEARDSLMTGLCSATGLVSLLLSEDEAAAAAGRISAVAGLEEMSRSLMAETRDRLAAGH